MFKSNINFNEIRKKLPDLIITSSPKIELIYDQCKKDYIFTNKVKDYFNAAGFQFSTLLVKGLYNEKNKLKHKRCAYKKCNNLFWAEDGKQIYCDDKCKRKDYYHRKVKAKNLLKRGFTVDEVYRRINKKSIVKTIKKWKKEIKRKIRFVCIWRLNQKSLPAPLSL